MRKSAAICSPGSNLGEGRNLGPVEKSFLRPCWAIEGKCPLPREASSLCLALNLSLSFSLQDVEPSSPAALAGLCPYTDYIVGSDQILQEVKNPWRACFQVP